MSECTELTKYSRGKNIVFQSIALAFIIIVCCAVGIKIFQNEIAIEEERSKSEMALRNYKTIRDLDKMTENYKAYKDEVAKVKEEAETTKKVVKHSAVTYTSRGEIINRNTGEKTYSVPTEYKEVLEVKATAYCLCKKCCGKSEDHPEYGVTRSGLKIVPGTGMKVIAVDPKIIPLGSTVYVEGVNEIGDYGYAVAADTGSAIKNYKIDLYMDSHNDTLNWGIKNMKVYVID